MGNITTALKHFLSADDLKKHLFAYAKIDCIMCLDEVWLKVYHYDKHWVDGGHFFKVDDNCGDHYHILFAPQGCVIKGFDHECEMSPYNFTPEIIISHDFYRGAPHWVTSLLNDPALENNITTFCTWQFAGDISWNFAPLNIPTGWRDGTDTFLSFTPDLKSYQKWFEDDYYESELDFNLLERIYNGEEITADMITAINPDADVSAVLKLLREEF